jgi:hypothetical protein
MFPNAPARDPAAAPLDAEIAANWFPKNGAKGPVTPPAHCANAADELESNPTAIVPATTQLRRRARDLATNIVIPKSPKKNRTQMPQNCPPA